MRPVVRAYAGLTVLAALLLVVAGRGNGDALASTEARIGIVVILIALCVVGAHVTFNVHSGWATHAGAAPHLAAALLLSPGAASAVAGIGMLVYVIHRRQPRIRAA